MLPRPGQALAPMGLGLAVRRWLGTPGGRSVVLLPSAIQGRGTFSGPGGLLRVASANCQRRLRLWQI